MTDYSEYTYGRTLRFFEAYYPFDTEDVHYANVMLSMRQCKTIDELIAVRERLKEKAEKVRNYEILGKLPKSIVDDLSKVAKADSPLYRDTSYRIKTNIESDANSCYDENLLRLFKESKEITEKSCGECFVNMTYCTSDSTYKDKIISEARERAGIDVSGLLNTIARRYREFGEHWNTYKTFKEGMNGYNAAKLAVEDDLEYLKQFGWRLLPAQKALYSRIDRIEIKKREQQAKLLKEKKAEREREKVLQLAEERKRKRNITIIKIVIFVALGLAILYGLIVWFASMDLGSDDGTIGNWIVAIIVLLAWLKGGKR